MGASCGETRVSVKALLPFSVSSPVVWTTLHRAAVIDILNQDKTEFLSDFTNAQMDRKPLLQLRERFRQQGWSLASRRSLAKIIPRCRANTFTKSQVRPSKHSFLSESPHPSMQPLFCHRYSGIRSGTPLRDHKAPGRYATTRPTKPPPARPAGPLDRINGR